MTRKVFVYGTLKRGYGNHRFLLDGGAESLGPAVTDRRFKMISVGFPVISYALDGHPVRGEVYAVSDETMARLDRLESEGRMYHRRVISVTLEYGKTITCEVYIGDKKYWAGYGPDIEPTDDGTLIWSRRSIPADDWRD